MNSSNNYPNSENQFSEEIDFKSLLKAILINKKLIFFVTLFSTLFSFLATYTQKSVYIGSFQMLAETAKDSANLSSNRSILPFIKNNSDNVTKKLILKSPSVLENVYLFNIEQLKKRGENTEEFTFKDWISRKLNIEFIDDSEILEISFKDEDKSLITKTLQMISLQYKKYSQKEREERLRKGIKYLLEQKSKLKEQSSKSLKQLNSFTIKNGLGDIDGFVDLSNESTTKSALKPNLRDIKQNIDINKTNSDKAGLRYSNQFNQLEYYESLYTDYSSKLKPNSKTLKDLDRKIKNLKSYLKRPNEILLEFRELKRISSRDIKMLTNIENQLQLYQLDIAKEGNSWENISEITIENKRFSPKRTKFLIYSFLISSILSSLLALIKYYYFGLIFDLNILKASITGKYLETIVKFEDVDIEIILNNIIKREIKSNQKYKVGLINLVNSKKEGLSINLDLFSKNDMFYELNIKDYKETDKCNYVAIIISPGTLDRNDILIMNQYINTFREKVIGWIYLEENKSKSI